MLFGNNNKYVTKRPKAKGGLIQQESSTQQMKSSGVASLIGQARQRITKLQEENNENSNNDQSLSPTTADQTKCQVTHNFEGSQDNSIVDII